MSVVAYALSQCDRSAAGRLGLRAVQVRPTNISPTTYPVVDDDELGRRYVRRMEGSLPAGLYVLVTDDLEIDLVTLRFHRDHYLLKSARPAVGASQTASAQHLARFRRWMKVMGYELEDMSGRMLREYLAYLLAYTKPSSGERLASNSINAMTSSVTTFYNWAADVGLIEAARIREGSLRVRSDQSVINIVPLSELREILSVYGTTLPSDACSAVVGDARSLGALIAFDVGLRISEVASLTVKQINELAKVRLRTPSALRIPLRIQHTKRLKRRTVYFSAWLIDALEAYVAGERAQIVAEAERLRRKTGAKSTPRVERHSGALILSNGYANTFGTPVRSAQLRRCFSEATSKARATVRTHYKFHELRHTYALFEWHRQLANGFTETRAYAYLQQALGHSHLETTQNRYMNSPGFLDIETQRQVRAFVASEHRFYQQRLSAEVAR